MSTLELEGRRAVALKGFTGDIAAKMQRKHRLPPLYAVRHRKLSSAVSIMHRQITKNQLPKLPPKPPKPESHNPAALHCEASDRVLGCPVPEYADVLRVVQAVSDAHASTFLMARPEPVIVSHSEAFYLIV